MRAILLHVYEGLVPTSPPWEVIEIDHSLDEWYRLVDTDMVESIGPFNEHGDGYLIDEEGKFKAKPINMMATYFARPFLFPGDVVVGEVMVVGPADRDGNTTEPDIEAWLDALNIVYSSLDALPLKVGLQEPGPGGADVSVSETESPG